jgi:hypothetical protein
VKLYQPVMFVGLGGTGCAIGAGLERRMREEICGPDGLDFRKLRNREDMLPYQLPSCIQFVYADLNAAELDRLPGRVASGPEHEPAVRLTASYVRDLVPRAPSYPDLARNLRMKIPAEIASWLPPASRDEPRTASLQKGAGQLPTIGRAALFGTFSDGSITPAVQDLRTAIGRLATAGEDLYALGGQRPRGVDVFVALSVAGGTGAGIFYDYLHLISETLAHHSQLRVRLYPLVLMPSAFPEGLGGGRAAELNAARALLDLFRLVDQQNGAEAALELRGAHDRLLNDPEELSVNYPGGLQIVMPPGTMQTGFLFSQPAGATRDDMHRSIVSLVMSLIGTEMSPEADQSGEHYQSFADSFVNMSVDRETLAENGIGNRGVSTALVASLTVPVDELSSIVGAHLLAAAVRQITVPQGPTDTTTDDIKDFLIKAGIDDLRHRPGAKFQEPPSGAGARAMGEALRDRGEIMKVAIDRLNADLARRVPDLAAHFDPVKAARDLLGRMDVFRLQRVGFGFPAAANESERTGVHGFLYRRTGRPAPPPGFGDLPPAPPELKDRLLRRVQPNDEVVVAARNQQDTWYGWQTHVAWAVHWNAHRRVWNRQLEQLQRDLAALTRALSDFANQDNEDFGTRSAALYRRRVGQSYLLPTGSGMELFYSQLIRRMREQKTREELLPVSASDAQLVRVLIDDEAWREAYRISVDESPENAVSYLREQVQSAVKRFLREPPSGEQPLLPRLHDLLTAAAGHTHGPDIQQDYLAEFGGKLAGLLPASFNPQGSGPMKVLINYPADAKNPVVEDYLRDSLNLPTGPNVTQEYRHTMNEALSVVLFRTSMGVTEVDEVRQVLRRWAGALDREEPTDRLRWRQRTGYDFAYLATRERHRVAILHRILCALWNGKGTIQGPEASPERLNITLGGGVTMTLPLKPLREASSWGNLLQAYELWALDGADVHREFCAVLLKELPEGLTSRPKPPDRLYKAITDLAAGQIELLDKMMKEDDEGHRSRDVQMHGFWADTLPAALDDELTGVNGRVAKNLRGLERYAGPGVA